MANKPLNINDNARRLAAQQAGQAVIEGSFESEPVNLTSVAEALNVTGVPYIFCYGVGIVTCSTVPGGPFIPLHDRAGVAVVVTIGQGQLVEVRGVHYVRFATPGLVVLTG